MYKCLECSAAFDVPREWTEPTGEQLGGCPDCGGVFDEAVQCCDCGEWFLHEDGIVKDLCPACALGAYTPELGVEYIEAGREQPIGTVRDFIAWYYNLPLLDGSGADKAADALFELIKNALNGDDRRKRQQAREAVKDYCLLDDEAWTRYVAERKADGQ